MNILDEYQSLVETDQWEKALPLIEHIVSLDRLMSTSWFNYGVCLDALKRHKEAGHCFLKAYILDQENYGAQYRTFRSFALADDEPEFKIFLFEEIGKDLDIVELLLEDEIFSPMLAKRSIKNIIEKTG